ncbi:hypothetical protein CDCA_CDCA07G2272 [Cyanidium caldarium]|uniref:Uncharacterized protein n=1 Tax=Cyanidium caldarium TaxID=2771 RepID=A0AAV9IV82_CYACA|nr:hypothetical protein CDCA_CDCA07G2272 [Cyanidium caldarium]
MIFMKPGYHAWRQHPLVSQRSNLWDMFPGLGTAIVIFSAYVGVEALAKRLQVSSWVGVDRAAVAYQAGLARGRLELQRTED